MTSGVAMCHSLRFENALTDSGIINLFILQSRGQFICVSIIRALTMSFIHRLQRYSSLEVV